MNIYGERIKAARLMRHWTQQELADKSGMTQATIQRYEAGLSDPQSRYIASLSKCLGVTVSYLLGLDDAATPDGLTINELHLIDLYRSTDDRGKAAIMAVAESQRGDLAIQAEDKQVI